MLVGCSNAIANTQHYWKQPVSAMDWRPIFMMRRIIHTETKH
jgi:hypothetical protein